MKSTFFCGHGDGFRRLAGVVWGEIIRNCQVILVNVGVNPSSNNGSLVVTTLQEPDLIVRSVVCREITPGIVRRGKLVMSSQIRPDKRSTK